MKQRKKTAVVTGASHGLGKAMVDLLSQEDITIFALARSIDTTPFASSVVKIPCNIRDLESIDQAFAQIDQKTEHIDLLINCAGRGLVKALEDTSRNEIMDVFGVNLKGNIYIAQEVYKRMIPKKTGHIVNVISTSGLRGRELEPIYAASKWGLRGFTESLKLAALQHNIRVTGVYPGGMKSENFWSIEPDKNIQGFMEPMLIAEQILHLIQSHESILPSELIIERTA